LLQRLVGLCGQSMQVELFEHEVIFAPAVQTPHGPARNDDVLLRLRSKVTPGSEFDLEKRQWQLCLQGPAEKRELRPVTMRPITNVNIHGEAFRFMETLGYKFSFEIVRRGYSFVVNDVIRVNVCQIFELEERHDFKTMRSPFDDKADGEADAKETRWLVEACSTFVMQDQVNQVAESLRTFKSLLNGIVDLEQIDPRAMQNRVQYV